MKSHAVKQYIETAWPTDGEGGALVRIEDNVEVAEKLGVSEWAVRQVIKNRGGTIIYHDRVAAREYYEKHPDASYREVARQVDSSQPTVTEWLKEDFNEGGDDDADEQQDTLAVVARDKDEAEQAAEVTRTAADGGRRGAYCVPPSTVARSAR